MKNNEWINNLQQRMANHQEPVKEEVWKAIQQRMAYKQSVKHTTPLIALWRKYAAVVLPLIILLSGGMYVMWQTKKISEPRLAQTKREYEILKNSKEKQPIKYNKTTNNTLATVTTTSKTNDKLTTKASKSNAIPYQQPKAITQSISHTDTAYDNQQAVTINKHTQQTVTAAGGVPTATQKVTKTEQYLAIQKNKKYSASTHHLSINVYATNALDNSFAQHTQNISTQTNPDYNMCMAQITSMGKEALVSTVTTEKQEVEHKQPIALGLSIGYALNKKLSLVSGMVYTQLSSTFTQITSNKKLAHQQHLYYIGVPLAVNYRVWKTAHLGAYITAGSQIDINVKAKSNYKENEYHGIEKDKLQLSTQAALGLQYNLTPHLGIYTEPGVKYYFNNNSATKNYWKEKPLQFNMQIGMRWTVF